MQPHNDYSQNVKSSIVRAIGPFRVFGVCCKEKKITIITTIINEIILVGPEKAVEKVQLPTSNYSFIIKLGFQQRTIYLK